jgi:hypothetical protein
MIPCDLSRALVTLWLLVLSVLDVRRRQLPHPLTTLPLLLIGGLISLRASASLFGAELPGQAWDNTAILLAFAAVLLSDTWLALIPGFAAAGTAFVLGSAVGQVIVVAWLLAVSLSKAGILGAGDAKVVMILLAVYPDVRLGAALLITITIVGAGLMLVQLRTAMPLWLLSIAHDLIAFKVPARTGEAGVLNLPLVPLLAVGAGIYLWLLI